MAKATDGPWRAGTRNGKALDTIYTADGGLIVATANTSAPEPGEREANARLIAAAPELLESLKELLSIVGNRLPIDSFCEAKAKALAVVALAEGAL